MVSRVAIFNKGNKVDWEEKYKEIIADYDKLYEENRELRKLDI